MSTQKKQFLILSDTLSAQELESELIPAFENIENIDLKIQIDKESTSRAFGLESMAPEVLSAIIASGVTLTLGSITLVVQSIISVWSKKKDGKNAMIVIKAGENEIQFPVGSTEVEIESYLKRLKELGEIQHVIIAADE